MFSAYKPQTNRLARLSAQVLISSLALFPAIATPSGDAQLPPPQTSLPHLGLSADSLMSPAQEAVLARVLWRDIRAEPDWMNDLLLSDYLQTMAQQLAAPLQLQALPKIRAFAIADPALNAFAMPGALIGVHSGLILGVNHSDELAAVIAHEIGHISQRHFARGQAQQKDNAWIGLAGFAAAILAAKKGNAQGDQIMQSAIAGSQAVQASKQLAFSRDMEREADAVGFNLMKQAQLDPSDMVRMLRRLGAASSLNESGTVYARTHPGTTERMANIEGRLKLPNVPASSTRDASLDFLLFQARVRALAAHASEQKSDAKANFEDMLSMHNAKLTPAAKNNLTIAAHYGLAVLAVRNQQMTLAGQLLKTLQTSQSTQSTQTTHATHPWIQSLAFEWSLMQTPAQSAINLTSHFRELEGSASNNAAARLHAIHTALFLDLPLSPKDIQDCQRELYQWLDLHPNDDQAWQTLASLYDKQGLAAHSSWARAEQAIAMGILPSGINGLNQALKLGEKLEESRVSIAQHNHWRQRLMDVRVLQSEEKALLDKLK